MSDNSSESVSILINPNRILIDDISVRLRTARKTKPVWAKRVDVSQQVRSIEGIQQLKAGDYLCRGILGELWPQSEKKLLDTYNASQEIDRDGFRRYDPKPNGKLVDVAQIDHPFRVIANWGELHGKPGDYVVRSREDTSDVWIVDRIIFQGSYDVYDENQDAVE